ncbi:MAG: sulfatase [Verrucomicrobiales bacterium]|nr:sulfatase [Verrucomicrobiales bacterium]
MAWLRFGVLLAMAQGTLCSASAAPPNVLFLIVDDLRPEMGCYGSQIAQTPSIDRLAKGALVFERAYCQEAICMASRFSLLSGLRPDERKIWTNRDVRPALQDIALLPQHFREHGYHTLAMGKIAHNSWEDPRCWSEPHQMPANAEFEYRTRAGRAMVEQLLKQAAAAGKPDPFRNIPEKIRRGMPFESLDVADDALGDGQIADAALEMLDRVRDRPFFLALGFLRPHLPFVAPQRHWDKFSPADLPLSESPDFPEGAPAIANSRSGELLAQYRGLPKKLPLSDETATQLRHGYLACVSYVDTQIGRVLQGLEDMGLAGNTIVVLTSDHGFQLGDHGMWGKATNFELAAHVPLLIRAPGQTTAGQHTQELVELVGLYPTLCDLAGLEKPAHLQGTSFASVLKQPDRELRQTAVSQFPRGEVMGYSLRTAHHRYTEWRSMKDGQVSARELYDYEADPLETRNLANQPEMAESVRNHAALLKKGLETGAFD